MTPNPGGGQEQTCVFWTSQFRPASITLWKLAKHGNQILKFLKMNPAAFSFWSFLFLSWL